MPLTVAQAENFVREFFRDHRLPAPAIGFRKVPRIDPGRGRKRLNLSKPITRMLLADQLAARLCRDVGRRAGHKRYSRYFPEWQGYTRTIVRQYFGSGDGL